MLLISSNFIVCDKLMVERHLLRYVTFCHGPELLVAAVSMGIAEVARVPLLRAHSSVLSAMLASGVRVNWPILLRKEENWYFHT